MTIFSLDELHQTANLVYQTMSPTPQYRWPLLCDRIETELWLKHENHTPTGAFKLRGSLSFNQWAKTSYPGTPGIVTATRGNHGQGQALAASSLGFKAKIVVPHGNSIEKNSAMRAFGADLVEYGEDFDAASIEAQRLSQSENLLLVPAFHPEIVKGVSSYALEFFTQVPNLDVVYVPIGCGSGICGLITIRDLLGLKTEIVGVVSTEADAARLSFESGKIIETESANTFADGMAVRVPVADAFEIYSHGAGHIVSVNDDEVAEAMRILFACTHNVVEGAGAATLAAVIQQKNALKNKKVGAILTGGNIDTNMFVSVLQGKTPTVN